MLGALILVLGQSDRILFASLVAVLYIINDSICKKTLKSVWIRIIFIKTCRLYKNSICHYIFKTAAAHLRSPLHLLPTFFLGTRPNAKCFASLYHHLFPTMPKHSVSQFIILKHYSVDKPYHLFSFGPSNAPAL